MALVQKKGVVLPSDINSELKTNTMIIGAFLSDLAASKKIRISSAKIGGSPVYYLESERAKLERLYQHLNEKDRRAYDLLKQSKILFDEDQSPLVKTCLREIKDFAFPLKVTFKEKDHLFWKWHLISDDDAKIHIKQKLNLLYPEKKDPVPVAVLPVKNIGPSNTPNQDKENNSSIATQKILPKLKEKKQSSIQQKIAETSVNQVIDDPFVQSIQNFLKSLNIEILSAEVVKKKSECNLIIRIPSQIGNLDYYCKAKNKKRSVEGDIAAAFVEGQLKGLPTVYVSAGDIPKKLSEQLPTKYKNLRVLTWALQ